MKDCHASLAMTWIKRMSKKKEIFEVPFGETKVLLHTCCAPCSSAIIECLMQHGVTPVIYYCNPNIYPREEYEIRKNECTRYAQSLGLEIVDADYDHENWLEAVRGLENAPERGGRCLKCFKLRLLRTAEYAAAHGIRVITSTLASSRWKSLDQINEAGTWACQLIADRHLSTKTPVFVEKSGDFSHLSMKTPVLVDKPISGSTEITSRLGVDEISDKPLADLGRISAVPSASARCLQNIAAAVAPDPNAVEWSACPTGAVDASRLGVESFPVMTPTYWCHNWKKGGLQERRLQIIKEYDFYNQLYCGCEFSMRKD